MVRASHRYREVTNSNSIKVLNFFFKLLMQLHKLSSQLRGSFFIWFFIWNNNILEETQSQHVNVKHSVVLRIRYPNLFCSSNFHHISLHKLILNKFEILNLHCQNCTCIKNYRWWGHEIHLLLSEPLYSRQFSNINFISAVNCNETELTSD